jgi:hypothetical protein
MDYGPKFVTARDAAGDHSRPSRGALTEPEVGTLAQYDPQGEQSLLEQNVCSAPS